MRPAGPNVNHPDTLRSYPLRSFILCELCGRRMQGRTRRRNSYYVCEPRKNWGQEAARRFPGHPPTVYVPQDALLEGIFRFFGERIFGPRRRELLEADQRALDGEPERKREGRIQALRRAVERVETRAARLIESLEREDDPEGVIFRRVRDRLAELEGERRPAVEELHAHERENRRDEPGSVELLDALPVADAEFGSLPEEVLRRLFEAFRLQVRYDPEANLARCRVVISGDSLDALLADVAHAVGAPNGGRHTRAPEGVAHAVCAPNRTVSEKPSPAGG